MLSSQLQSHLIAQLETQRGRAAKSHSRGQTVGETAPRMRSKEFGHIRRTGGSSGVNRNPESLQEQTQNARMLIERSRLICHLSQWADDDGGDVPTTIGD